MKIKIRAVALLSVSALALTACLEDAGNMVTSFGGQTANATALAVCIDDPHVGRPLAEIVGRTGSYTANALGLFYDGMADALAALNDSRAVSADLVTAISGQNRDFGFESGFGESMTVITAVTDQGSELAQAVERMEASGLEPATLAKLERAHEQLYVANVLMVKAAMGFYQMYKLASNTNNEDDVARLLQNEGLEQLTAYVSQQPQNLYNLAMSFVGAGELTYTINQVTNFSEDKQTLRAQGIEAQLDAFDSAATLQAKSLSRKHPDKVDMVASGETLRQELQGGKIGRFFAANFGSGADDVVSGFVESTCASVVGGNTLEAKGGDREVFLIQQALNEQGLDVGTPDGKMGPKTRRAVMQVEAQLGLAQDGEIDEELKAGLGVDTRTGQEKMVEGLAKGAADWLGNALGAGN